MPKSTDVVETRIRERCDVGIESKTPVERNAKKLNMFKLVPEILMEFKSESVDSFLEVPSRIASDLEGLRANQL